MTALVIVGLLLALADEWQAQGRSLLGWAVVFVCLGLLWNDLARLL